MRTGNIVGLLVLGGIAAYVMLLFAQRNAAAELCDRYPVGSSIEDLDDLDGTLLLTRMGPLDDPENPGTERVIFCAGLTMCDTSCSLEIRDRVVTKAKKSDL